MARSRDAHPLGKCSEERVEILVPGLLKKRLHAIATIHGKTATAWARDVLEKAIEGEWIFMQRRVGAAVGKEQPQELPEEYPDA
jgi:plasmid stability protein